MSSQTCRGLLWAPPAVAWETPVCKDHALKNTTADSQAPRISSRGVALEARRWIFFCLCFFFFFFETGSCHGAQACLYLPSAGIIGMYYHSQVEDKFYSKYLFCFFFVCLFSFFLIFFLELGSCYIAQAGFGLLGSSNPPASASPKTRTIGTHHHAWFFVFFQVQEQRHWSLPA
jgi:hypothetical protein